MTERRKLIEKMVGLGISEKEARIYSVLLQKRELTALEIQRTADVPRTKVYEITQRMISNNMCIEKLIRGKKKYQAIEPGKFLHNLTAKFEKELNRKKKLAEEIEKTAAAVYDRSLQSPDRSMSVEMVSDQRSIYERYVDLVSTTKKTLVGFVKPPYAHQNNVLKLIEQDDMMFRKIDQGVEVRMLYEIPRKQQKSTYDYIRSCVKRGEKARVISHVPAKLYIFDEQRIALALPETELAVSPLTMFVIRHRPLAQAGNVLFNHLWAQAQDYHVLATSIKKRDIKGNRGNLRNKEA